MRCQICNRETNNWQKDKDGHYVSICSRCRTIVRETANIYQDFDEDDIKLLKAADRDLQKYAEGGTTDVQISRRARRKNIKRPILYKKLKK